jgi:conserved oligomeric Golgi complex subunit 2
MSAFHLPSETTTATSTPAVFSDSDDDDDTLPYPTELPRSAFLTPDFDPQTYLSTLRNRHQTLEDLRSDLRQRSQLLNRELLDLVNGHYEEFLSLGHDLKGGEEKVEGVRVGVLGFQREVEGVRKVVSERQRELGALMHEKKDVRRDVVLGRTLLEVHQQLAELEENLGMTENDEAGAAEEEDRLEEEGGTDDEEEMAQMKRLRRHAQQYILITRMFERVGLSHPFLQSQRMRLVELKRTLLLDLAAALRLAHAQKQPDAILAIVRIYSDLGAEKESLRVLKGE